MRDYRLAKEEIVITREKISKNRLIFILKQQFYRMSNNDNNEVYKPLNLKWILPINSNNGMISVLKNTIFLLNYVQKNKCDNKYIDAIIENDMQPITSRLSDEFDLILASVVTVLCTMTEDFSDINKTMKLSRDILGDFIYTLEMCLEQFYSIKDNTNDNSRIQNVDTSNLVVGMVVKNYKELCKLLNENVLEGNSKKAQLKEWERYFLWEKKGQKFIILEIYDEPLPKNDGRQNRNVYVQYIEVILMKLLSKQKNNKYVFYITTRQLWKLLGMINNDYKSISLEDLNDKIPEYKVTSFDVNKFYQRCNQRLRDILYSSLNNLQTRSLIKYEIETVIVSKDEKNNLLYSPANDIQKKKILKAERKALLDMGLESKRHVYAKFKDEEFFEKLNAYLQEWYGWEYTFKRIKIIYNKSDILDTVDDDEEKLKESFDEIKIKRLELNEKVVEALYKNVQTMVENRHKKADIEYQIAVDNYMDEHLVLGSIPDSCLPTKKEFGIFDYLEYSPYFVEIQNRLTDELISLKKPQNTKIFIEFNDEDQKELDELFKN